MGTSFLIAGTVFFFTGLGCLLLVFIGIARRLKTNVSTSVYFRAKRSYRPWIFSILGLLLIGLAQGSYWFHNQVDRYIPFDTSVPQARIDFIYEEFRQPRVSIEATDQHHQKNTQVVPFAADSIALGIEVVEWKRAFQVFGLKDCYRINGVYYVNSPDDTIGTLSRLPNHDLNGGPSGLLNLAEALGESFPAKVRLIISPPVETTGKFAYSLQLGKAEITAQRLVDNQHAAN